VDLCAYLFQKKKERNLQLLYNIGGGNSKSVCVCVCMAGFTETLNFIRLLLFLILINIYVRYSEVRWDFMCHLCLNY